MGKGSNVQKAQQARERNQKKMGKTDEGKIANTAGTVRHDDDFITLASPQWKNISGILVKNFMI